MDFTKIQVCQPLPLPHQKKSYPFPEQSQIQSLFQAENFRPKSCLIGLFLIISVGIHLGLVVAVVQINYYIHPTPS